MYQVIPQHVESIIELLHLCFYSCDNPPEFHAFTIYPFTNKAVLPIQCHHCLILNQRFVLQIQSQSKSQRKLALSHKRLLLTLTAQLAPMMVKGTYIKVQAAC